MPDTNPMPRENTKPWYDPGLSFKCTRCGNCCTGPAGVVWISDEEAQHMADYLGLGVDEFLERYAERRYDKWTLREVLHEERGYDCVFLKFDRQTGLATCTVHPVRPTQCWSWPFWPENLRSARAWKKAGKTCPGIRKGGEFFPVEQIRIMLSKNPKDL